MVGIDGNGRGGGVEKRRYSEMVEVVVLRRQDIPLTCSPSFHFFYFSLFLSFSPSFFLDFLFFSFVLLL